MHTKRTPEEHFAPAGPVGVAVTWLAAVLERQDLAHAWPHTDHRWRLAWAQNWITANRRRARVQLRDRDELAWSLATKGPKDPLWRPFARTELEALHEALPSDLHRWAVGGDVRPVDDEHEVVLLIEHFGPSGVHDPTQPGGLDVRAGTVKVLMHRLSRRRGWAVAGLGDPPTPPAPGWPD